MAALMLVLPVVYLAMIALVCYGVWWFATLEPPARHGGGGGPHVLVEGFFYWLVLICGCLLALFLIKPLLAPRAGRRVAVPLNREEQALLYAFVDRLAHLLRAPAPTRIDVDCQANASAGFDGSAVAFWRGETVLTIGMPLVTGLSVAQLAGVLAHELGHFAQGRAMRLTYLIRVVNDWFASVAGERDEWDEHVDEMAAGNVIFQVLLVPAKLLTELTRPVLKLLALAGHVVSFAMLRQMEFDADRYEVRLVGADAFARTNDRLVQLEAASHAAADELKGAWREGQLCDDLPLLIANRDEQVPEQVRAAVPRAAREARPKTGWFDTHPDDATRIARARRAAEAERDRPTMACDAPAVSLFADVAGVSRRATAQLYDDMFDGAVPPERVCPTTALIADYVERRARLARMQHYFNQLIDPRRPVFPADADDGVSVPDPRRLAQQVAEARRGFKLAAAHAEDLVERFETADERALCAAAVEVLRTNDVAPPRTAHQDLLETDDAGLRELRRTADASRGRAVRELDAVLAPAMRALELCVAAALGRGRAAPPGDPPQPPLQLLVDTMEDLQSAHLHVEALRVAAVELGSLLDHFGADEDHALLLGGAVLAARRCRNLLSNLQAALGEGEYPYERADGRVRLACAVVPWVGSEEEVGAIHAGALDALEAYYTLYLRVLSDLTAAAERVADSFNVGVE